MTAKVMRAILLGAVVWLGGWAGLWRAAAWAGDVTNSTDLGLLKFLTGFAALFAAAAVGAAVIDEKDPPS